MSQYITKKTPGDKEWFIAERFGLFVHWGINAMSDSPHGVWMLGVDCTPEEKYQKYYKYFNPDLFAPKEWAKMAKAAGMKYVVFITKHHDGFCLFDSQYTDYKSTNTLAGKDLIRECVDAFRAEGFHIGFYYSLLDWHHPQFTIDGNHPLRQHPNAHGLNEERDMSIYCQYMRNQVTELLTNYGKIDIMWYDFSYETPDYDNFTQWTGWKGKGYEDWEGEELIKLTRSLQPGILINNRIGKEQDFRTPEQFQVTDWVKDPITGELVVWEACQTLNGEWAYRRDKMKMKSPETLIHMLVNTVSCGGNLLMNVGPTPRGYFDKRAEAALQTYADWMKYNGKSIYHCTKADEEFKVPQGCRLTQSIDGKRLYVHLMEYPYQFLLMPGYAGKVDYAQFLHDGSEILFTEGKTDHFSKDRPESPDLLAFKLPIEKPEVIVPVIEIFLK